MFFSYFILEVVKPDTAPNSRRAFIVDNDNKVAEIN